MRFMNSSKNKLNSKKNWFFKPMPNAHFVDKLRGANISFLGFPNFKAFDLLKVGIILVKK